MLRISPRKSAEKWRRAAISLGRCVRRELETPASGLAACGKGHADLLHGDDPQGSKKLLKVDEVKDRRGVEFGFARA